MNCCLVAYTVDLSIRAFADGYRLFKRGPALMDLVIICTSIVELVLDFMKAADVGSSLLLIRMIRLVRLLRLMRVVKLFAGMKELRKLTQMIATCAKTMFWSFLMSFLVMTMWAVAAVELIQPVAQRLDEEGAWHSCERCPRAFESVMSANLTFFQTIMAGDGWGIIAIPIIEAAPHTAFVFCGVLLSLVYGMMQLINAVVVDTFADLRNKDVEVLADEMDQGEIEEKAFLQQLFHKIDEDHSGCISFNELVAAAHTIREFQHWLRVVDIDAGDLARLYEILDADGSGAIDVNEFIDVLYRLKNADSATTAKLVKHMIEKLEMAVQQTNKNFHDLQKRMDRTPPTQTPHQESAAVDIRKTQEAFARDMEEAFQRACATALQASLAAAADRVQLLMKDDSCYFMKVLKASDKDTSNGAQQGPAAEIDNSQSTTEAQHLDLLFCVPTRKPPSPSTIVQEAERHCRCGDPPDESGLRRGDNGCGPSEAIVKQVAL
eukprot:TRINITY_DN19557_c0_g1_i2.p1 TRINITY_DN19557_c0_g1~~TRINITY_DN19557_c0_g1_i2.p1  ORF type:complete len:492 (-),score=87.48 TRINITY_DN19557_c0_g1_i2:557-2032(-)